MRQHPEITAPMKSQLLFGESFTILEENQGWIRIALDHDSTHGWVDKESIKAYESSTEEVDGSPSNFRIVTLPSLSVRELDAGYQLILPAGATWPSDNSSYLALHGSQFELISPEGLESPGKGVDLNEVGKGLRSLPSLSGGRCGFGFDAPGLVQMLYALKGVQIPRFCEDQSKLGESINFLHEVKEGDLAFFDNSEGEIDHVGVLLESGRILHVYQQVRIDRFDQQGIYNSEKEKYTHQLRIIKRVE